MTLRTKLLSTAAGLHPAQLTRLELKLDPATAVLDRWRLYRIHHFAVVGDAWSELTQQVTRDTWPGHVAHLGGVQAVCIGTHASVDRMHWIVQMANRELWSTCQHCSQTCEVKKYFCYVEN